MFVPVFFLYVSPYVPLLCIRRPTSIVQAKKPSVSPFPLLILHNHHHISPSIFSVQSLLVHPPSLRVFLAYVDPRVFPSRIRGSTPVVRTPKSSVFLFNHLQNRVLLPKISRRFSLLFLLFVFLFPSLVFLSVQSSNVRLQICARIRSRATVIRTEKHAVSFNDSFPTLFHTLVFLNRIFLLLFLLPLFLPLSVILLSVCFPYMHIHPPFACVRNRTPGIGTKHPPILFQHSHTRFFLLLLPFIRSFSVRFSLCSIFSAFPFHGGFRWGCYFLPLSFVRLHIRGFLFSVVLISHVPVQIPKTTVGTCTTVVHAMKPSIVSGHRSTLFHLHFILLLPVTRNHHHRFLLLFLIFLSLPILFPIRCPLRFTVSLLPVFSRPSRSIKRSRAPGKRAHKTPVLPRESCVDFHCRATRNLQGTFPTFLTFLLPSGVRLLDVCL
eukprot:comp16755_c0_seq1/m.15098 comp16755_c0_seq1/g.15098  ORF comp16755_c0_seq1/g.15098 comp16755_c0_seq1/m.15098 type:complete len:437 (+) comp16755_c0_seq1:1131-2441(+)